MTMATHMQPSWHGAVTDEQRAVCKAVGVRWETLPRKFFMDEPAPIIVAPSVAPPSDLTETEWRQIRATGVIPKAGRRNGVDWRRVINATLYLKTTNTRWVNLPARYHSSQSVRKSCERLATLGLWAELLHKLEAGEVDLDPARTRTLAHVARDWSARGVKFARARERGAN
jgi:hypothetical protein